MTTALPFRRLIHCDWSMAPAKRWRADAIRQDTGWFLSVPRPVGPLPAFVADLFAAPEPMLAGFDMPIGLPEAIGRRTDAAGFRDWLFRLGSPGRWQDFFQVNREAGTIRLERPFFPDRWMPGITAALLTRALAVADLDALRRACERRRPGRRAATPLFWTVGPAQVGKAAISGWRDVLQPALARGAALWPFDGPLAELAEAGGPVLAETYPGEVYGHLDVVFGPRRSKRRTDDRREVTMALPARCRGLGIMLAPDAEEAVRTGFQAFGAAGEDAFDALIGLLGMIDVADGRRLPLPAGQDGTGWERWILGQPASTSGTVEDGSRA